jgi:glutamate-1-semialdehyde 2,1-aminomutase
MATTTTQLDRQRIRELTEREERRLNERTQASQRMYERARSVLTGGVASSYQLREPWPIYLEHGEGPRVWDVDGNEMYDFHNGFGSMVQGHAHPVIGKAIGERYVLGTHFAAPTEDAIVVGGSSRAAGTSIAGATRTPARSPRWTPFASPAPTPSATR